MKRLIVAALLAGFTLTAHADFTRYFEDDELIAYLDRESITRSGNEARLWTIDDYHKPQDDIPGRKPHRSIKVHWIFDCAKRMSDVLVAFYYAEPMARGEEVHAGAADQRSWDKVEPGSVGELAFRAACAGPAVQSPAKPAS
ncbi:MAG: surface-adhesin E family protein [Burkholderiales bacterium]